MKTEVYKNSKVKGIRMEELSYAHLDGIVP